MIGGWKPGFTSGDLVAAMKLNEIGITVRSVMAGGPPASPNDKDIWIATDVDANGTRWEFQYNAESESAYKWEFIGGAPMGVAWPFGNASAVINIGFTELSGTANAWADFTAVGPRITVARAGDYAASGSAQMATTGPAGTSLLVGVAKGATDPDRNLIAVIAEPVSKYFAQLVIPTQTLFDVTAGGEIRLRYYTEVASMAAQLAHLTVAPVRVA